MTSPDANTHDTILLAHGSGGRLSRDLVQQEIVPRFGEDSLQGLPDGATLPALVNGMVFTTDSFVVSPLLFPGGNIGHLAIHGTVNDLAVCGAKPRWLSLALIIEEGLPLALLRLILDSVKTAAEDCGVSIVTGDTKVVEKGHADGLFINTSGIGERIAGFDLAPAKVRSGDRVLVSGTLADHGMAVLACRRGIDIQNGPSSDTAPVHRLVQAAAPWAGSIRFMRDPTRGGAAATLNEVTEGHAIDIDLDETAIPFSPGVRAMAEILGIDPMHAASEGRLFAICSAEAAEAVIATWRTLPEGHGAACIGRVATGRGRVIMNTVTGGRRLVDVPRGELLPRIC